MKPNKPNEQLQAKLREMIDRETITEVATAFGMSRESLAKYVANLPLQRSSFLGIESAVASAEWPRVKVRARRAGSEASK